MKKIFILLMAAMAFASASAQDQEEQQTVADRLYLQIMQSYKAQDWDEVTSLIDQVAQAGENTEEFEVIYAQALYEKGDYQGAHDRLEPYVEKYPQEYQAWSLFADACSQLGLAQQAVEAYDHCSELQPSLARPWACSARALKTTNPTEATERYKEAIRIYIESGKLGNAIKIGSEAVAIAPADTELLMLVGDALDKAAMPDQALAFYAEVVALNAKAEQPDVQQVAAAEYAIALIYYDKGDYQRALQMLEGAIDNDSLAEVDSSAYARMLCLASATCERMGDTKKSAALLEKAKGVDPEGAEAMAASFLAK